MSTRARRRMTPSAAARSRATRRPKDDLIRFVLGPERRDRSRPEGAASRPRRVGHRGPWHSWPKPPSATSSPGRSRRKPRCPQGLPIRSTACLADAALGGACPCQQGRRGGVRHCQGRGGHRQRPSRRPYSCQRSRGGRLPQARRQISGSAQGRKPGPASALFSADELGLASGKTNVIHAALIQGGAAAKFLASASRAERYRKGRPQPLPSQLDRTRTRNE